MKIIICIKRDLEGCIALNYLLKHIESHDYTVILSDKFTAAEREVKESADFIFYERDLLVHQIFPLLEKNDKEEYFSEYLTFNQIKKKYHIPVVVSDDINSKAWENYIRNINPDMILSVRNDFIFKKNIIDIPGFGIYNVHPGSLPEYRGVYAPFRAMLNGEATVGCTLHRVVDEGIDTGPIVDIKTMPVDYSKSVLWHMCQLYPLGIDLFKQFLAKYEIQKKIETFPQDESKKRYYTFPGSEEFNIFTGNGHKLIDNQEYLDMLGRFSPVTWCSKTIID
ncbi:MULTISPECIES: formyl transferase [Desulfobacula]|uniref:Predicted methionyl-tRNA formyltransferase n=2 Tax=Desulfobacula TaxID=28222 RepID=K0NLR9_DESTT|nr:MULTISPECIES: formyl transferase [Desulfobacula]CCK80973.1 predicted methionyl-tRNA formyltransferase [Desulfobacula toluolica Tol2]SDT85024.1 Formyl transferase [Desulfobacula phenolica]